MEIWSHDHDHVNPVNYSRILVVIIQMYLQIWGGWMSGWWMYWGDWSSIVGCLFFLYSVAGRMNQHSTVSSLVLSPHTPYHHANHQGLLSAAYQSRGQLVDNDSMVTQDFFINVACCHRTTHRGFILRVGTQIPDTVCTAQKYRRPRKPKTAPYCITWKPNIVYQKITEGRKKVPFSPHSNSVTEESPGNNEVIILSHLSYTVH